MKSTFTSYDVENDDSTYEFWLPDRLDAFYRRTTGDAICVLFPLASEKSSSRFSNG